MRLSVLLLTLCALIVAPATAAADEAQDFRFPGADTQALQNGSDAYITYGATIKGYRVPWSVSGSGNVVGTSPVVRGDALPVARGAGAWAVPDSPIWTPGAWYMVKRGVGYYYLFYTATQRRPAGAPLRKCIGVAVSTSPVQGFTPQDKPLACPTRGARWALDADVVQGPEGAVWMVYRDGERANGPESALSVTMLKFGRKGGVRRITEPKVIMRSDALTWAHYRDRGVTVIENPSALYANGSWYLFYSGNSWPTNYYSTGVAYCGPTLDGGECSQLGGPARAYFAYRGPGAALPKSMRVRGLPGNHRGPGAMDVYHARDGQPWVTWNYLSDAGGRRSTTGRLLVTGTGATASFRVSP